MKKLLLLAPLLLVAGVQDPPARLNVLFIAVDDLRPSLGCFGDPIAKSPNLDALAARGTVFLRAYCQQAVCSPSRSSLLTGRRPDTTKVYDLETHFRKALPDVVTLPQHFKTNGWHTQSFGKIYHGGFDDPPSWSEPSSGPKKPGNGPEGQALLKKLKDEAPPEGRTRVRGLAWEAPDVADAELADGSIADQSIEALERLKDRPFFLAVGFLKPHLPFVAPKKYWDLYDGKLFSPSPHRSAPQGAPPYALQPGGELRAYHGIPKQGPIPDDAARALIHGYHAAVSYMDAQVGRVLAALDRHGLRDKTLVVVWGDHGWHLGDHGMWCKHTNYEKATRAALVVSVPGQKAPGRKTSALVELVDVYPTLAERCGLPLPAGLEGTSFSPLLDDPGRAWKTGAISQYPRAVPGEGRSMGYALRTDRWRLVEWKVQNKEFVQYELYDLQNDPDEDVNLAGRPEHAETVKELAARLTSGWPDLRPAK